MDPAVREQISLAVTAALRAVGYVPRNEDDSSEHEGAAAAAAPNSPPVVLGKGICAEDTAKAFMSNNGVCICIVVEVSAFAAMCILAVAFPGRVVWCVQGIASAHL